MSAEQSPAARVRAMVAAYLDLDDAEVDPAQEAVAIRVGTAAVFVRLLDGDPPVLRVYSPLLRGVDATPALLADLNDVNARTSFVRLFWREDCVFAAMELVATLLDDLELEHACDTVAEVADFHDVRLQGRFGGEIAFSA